MRQTCTSLAGKYVNDVRVTSATWIRADGATLHTDACRVLGTRAPFLDMEVDLPANWTGRLVQIAGHGFGGVIAPGITLDSNNRITAVSPVIADAHAVYATSNSGSRADVPAEAEPTVTFSGSMEGLLAGIDFEYQSVGTTIFFAKNLAEMFYQHRPAYTYLIGCSQGGHDADEAIQRWGNQYNGIVKGCWSMDAVASGTNSALTTRQSMSAGLSAAQGQAAYDAAIAQCDADDGLSDGVIANPRGCDFDPADLRCGASGANPDPALCLTADQAGFVKARLSDVTLSDGTLVYSAHWWSDYTGRPSGGAPSGLLFYLISGDNGWTDGSRLASLDIDAEFPPLLAQAQRVGIADDLPRIASWVASGGKFLSWTGGADPVVSPLDTTRNVAEVAELAKGYGLADPRRGVRDFVIPGAVHGAGAELSQVDWVTAIINWVERGKAPDQLTYIRTLPGASEPTSIPICETPKYPRYRGHGDPGSAKSFFCTTNQAR
jgi:hypothetical protein